MTNKYTLYNGSLFDYSHSFYCGVLMTEKVMRSVSKLQARYLEDLKRILTKAADDGDIYPSMWTIHHPEGVQTHVKFIDKSADVYKRIEMATVSNQPKHEPVVFIASDMKEAERMADARYAEVGEKDYSSSSSISATEAKVGSE